jgi:uncharacterized membrane protein
MFKFRFARVAIVLLLALTPLVYQSCTYDTPVPSYCFQEDVLPIFVSKCSQSGCHNAIDKEEDLDLTNYNGIMKGVKAGKPMSSECYTEINSGSMPPSNSVQLTQLEKSTIKAWIKAGAENTANCNTCDSTFTYAARIQPLMDKWCVGCHSANYSGGQYDLSNYNGVVKAVTNKRLLGSIKQQSGYSAMPQGTSPISDCDIIAVTKWINAGHPNN